MRAPVLACVLYAAAMELYDRELRRTLRRLERGWNGTWSGTLPTPSWFLPVGGGLP